MRAGVALTLAAVFLGACAPAPPPVQSKKQDPTQETWYAEAIEKLAALNGQAKRAFDAGKFDDASNLILEGEPLEKRLLDVPRPTLPAMEAASDLDQLYGQMLLANRNYGWARLQFQKNRARWKSWQPQTPETARRLKLAEDGIAECDRLMEQ